MALRLAREEGLFGGTSTGANLVAALRVAEDLGTDSTVVTVMCDTGMKYLHGYSKETSQFNGPIAKALMTQAATLLATPPAIERLDVLGAKLPGQGHRS